MIKAKAEKYPCDKHKIFRKQGNILGVNITGTPKEELLTRISKYLDKRGYFEAKSASNNGKNNLLSNSKQSGELHPLFITTPNPEQAVLANKDNRFAGILQSSDISLCDGVGLLTAYEYFLRKSKENLSNRSKVVCLSNLLLFLNSSFSVLNTGVTSDGVKVVKGRGFMLDLLEIANDKRYKVFLLGSSKRVLKRSVGKLRKMYPSVHFLTNSGSRLNTNSVPLTDKEMVSDKESLKAINRFRPNMLFVAYGSPKQEKWVYRNIDKIKSDLVMVVGSSFDYIAGTRKPVPQIMDRIGLEWLWRLLTGSQSISRIYHAVIVFPFLVMKES